MIAYGDHRLTHRSFRAQSLQVQLVVKIFNVGKKSIEEHEQVGMVERFNVAFNVPSFLGTFEV